ncbi:MAG TPA: DNA repair ATPase [Ilumatobacter sp.]|nr:DNA repair ATPase [Ilumatobacter sp.]
MSETATTEAGDAQLTGGNYELLRRRLGAQTEALLAATTAVDAIRTAAFGGTQISLTGASRLATAVACRARDATRVGDVLVLGYNTELELGTITPEHVFALYAADPNAAELAPLAADDPRNFLGDPTFREDFDKLYRFYGKARFSDLRVTRNQLLAVFRVGEREQDIQVLRWAVTDAGGVSYLDARGDRDYTFPAAHDLDWRESTREDQRAGAYPVTAVLDEVFVGFRAGRLQLRVDTGMGDTHAVIDEAVANPNQSLTDVAIRYATTGDVLLIDVALYGEGSRTYVFSRSTRGGVRVDAAGHSSRMLPGGNGIVFCGGYHTAASGTRTFDVDTANMALEEVIAAPNGEDLLYVYHRRSDGAYLLMPYNLVRHEIAQVIPAHGFAIFDNGSMVLFRGQPQDAAEAVSHPIQWWTTPFTAPDHVPPVAAGNEWAARVGNPALVSGLGAIFELSRIVTSGEPTQRTWENAAAGARRILDTNLWLNDNEAAPVRAALTEAAVTVGSLIDEYAVRERKKVQARNELVRVDQQVRDTLAKVGGASTAAAVVAMMGELRRTRGAVAGLGELEQLDPLAIEPLAQQLDEANVAMSARAITVLADATAFATFHQAVDTQTRAVDEATTTVELDAIAATLAAQAHDLDAVVDTVAAIDSGDPTVRTGIVRSVSDITGALNRARSILDQRRRALAATETGAAFDAERGLVEQTMGGSVATAATPEDCDAVLARLLVNIERLDSRYGDDPERGADLAELRNAVHEAVSAKRTTLVDERNRRASRLVEAGNRLIETVARRAAEQTTDQEVEAFLATDQMPSRVRELADELESLGDAGRAAEMRSALRLAAETARRRLRDRTALGGDDNVIKLGSHRLSRTLQPYEVVLAPTGDGRVSVTVTGTDYASDVTEQLSAFVDLLASPYPSEAPDVSRSEYLAWAVIADAERSGGIGALVADAANPTVLAERIARLAERRHHDGYQRGVHDHDAARILTALSGQLAGEPLLRYTASARALARLWWHSIDDSERTRLTGQLGLAAAARVDFGSSEPVDIARTQLEARLLEFVGEGPPPWSPGTLEAAAAYLVDEVADGDTFIVSDTATELLTTLESTVGAPRSSQFVAAVNSAGTPVDRFLVARQWLAGFVGAAPERDRFRFDIDEAAAHLACRDSAPATRSVAGAVAVAATGLVADHARIVDGSLSTRLDALAGTAGARFALMESRWPAYIAARQAVIHAANVAIGLADLRPKPMAGFVRNSLIDQTLLPLFGSNLARQFGTVDATDAARQGLLVVVSPPGYGKTTLLEWLADQLGVLIVKVNGPALGQDTVSLDPADAPNATARAEVEKINLAFRLGRNVLLYVDDIQHTSPVLLSRFIPLADATRRIEGVIDGQAHTFDLRGKRFGVVMAGNPYTTGGGRFEMPDMLVNRADVHNLGDVSASHADSFAASYLDNSVTANPALAPHAARLLDDLDDIRRMAAGSLAVDSANLTHNWDASDLDASVRTVRQLGRARDALLAVNSAYIASASTTDEDRPTPAFLLQGSYRNMARIAARVVPVMTDTELDTLLDEHYAAEAQTLTDRSEENLLAYKHLVGRASEAEQARWAELVAAYRERQAAAHPASAVVRAIDGLAAAVRDGGDNLPPPPPPTAKG